MNAPRPAPLISLVIATLHDDGELAQCLNSLAAQHGAPAFEVIIVDQNGDDRLANVVRSCPAQLDILHLQVDFRGASRARNLGARHAKGAWIGFPDDDCFLLPDTLKQVHATLVAWPNARVISGRTVAPDGQPNVLRWHPRTVCFTPWNMFACLTEATLFVQRDTFSAVGGFDENFGPGAAFPAAEGMDLMNRLFRNAIRSGQAVFNPAIQMQHPSKVPPWNRWAAARFHSYAIGDGALVAKSPQLPILYWAARAMASAVLQTLMCRGWRSAAFGARVGGLVRGWWRYQRQQRPVRP